MTAGNKKRTPVQARAVETRKKIINAGLELFQEKGYHKINAIDIANKAGMATGTLYIYFNNKREILIECIKMFFRDVNKLIIRNADKLDKSISNGPEFIKLFIKIFNEGLNLNPQLYREICAMIYLDSVIQDLCRSEDRKIIHIMDEYFEKHKDLFKMSDVHAVSTLIYRTCVVTMQEFRLFSSSIDKERLLDQLAAMLLSFLYNK